MSSENRQASVLANLSRLGYTLPAPPPSRAEYAPYRHVGEAIHIAGQLPFLNGELPGQGQRGRDVELSVAQDMARLAALMAGNSDLPTRQPLTMHFHWCTC